MSFTLGTVTFPVNPRRVTVKQAKNIKSYMLMTQMPALLDLGPQTRVLTLEGFIAKAGKTAAELETDYLIPLTSMASKRAAIPMAVADDNQAAFWVKREVSGTLSIVDDAVDFRKGVNSLKWTCTPSAGTLDVGVRKYYSSALDLSGQDFVSLWLKGANKGGNFNVYFSIDAENTWTNRYSWSTTDNFTSWTRFVIRKDEFTVVGAPNWKNVTNILISYTGSGLGTASFNVWNDRFMVGVGYLLTAPGTRYDGIYAVNAFNYEEVGGATRMFNYIVELWFADDYY